MANPDAYPVVYEVADAVGSITLSRPEAMNSLDTATKDALLAALRDAAHDPEVRCVCVAGTGRAYSVGQDLREHAEMLASRPLDDVWSTVDLHYGPIAHTIATMEKPVVAAVNGIAAGAGMSIALACDLRIAAESAGFNTAFTGIGLSCDTGSSWTLPRLVGRGLAMDLLLRPRTVHADEALRIGLVSQVVPDAELPSTVANLARELATGPTVAYGAVKQSVAFAATHSLTDSLVFESQLMARTGSTQDHRDAVGSFVAKEKPTFEGR
jgi:2-(1,2-epoxy-1,2-dihydrophenyl)acetyl-CoA isomerase